MLKQQRRKRCARSSDAGLSVYTVKLHCALNTVFLLPCRHVRGAISAPPAHEKLRLANLTKLKSSHWRTAEKAPSKWVVAKALVLKGNNGHVHEFVLHGRAHDEVAFREILNQVEVLRVIPADFDRLEIRNRVVILAEQPSSEFVEARTRQ